MERFEGHMIADFVFRDDSMHLIHEMRIYIFSNGGKKYRIEIECDAVHWMARGNITRHAHKHEFIVTAGSIVSNFNRIYKDFSKHYDHEPEEKGRIRRFIKKLAKELKNHQKYLKIQRKLKDIFPYVLVNEIEDYIEPVVFKSESINAVYMSIDDWWHPMSYYYRNFKVEKSIDEE